MKVKSQEMFTRIFIWVWVQIIGSGFLCEHDEDEEQKYIWNGELEYLVPYATISTEESTSPGSVFWNPKNLELRFQFECVFENHK